MGKENGRCDSCGKEKTVLFPILILDELSTGGEQMVMKYYCAECFQIMIENEESDKNENDDEEWNDEDWD
jgi:hypothetical protein